MIEHLVGFGIAMAVLVMLGSVGMYFLPTIVALARSHRQSGAIAALNFLLGWTVLGWVGALVWSLTTLAPTPTVVFQPSPPAASPPTA